MCYFCGIVRVIMSSADMTSRLRVFESGVMVLQLQSHSEDAIIADTDKAVCNALVVVVRFAAAV